MRSLKRLAILFAALYAAVPARAVELHLQFGALERMLSEQVFTQDGRRYVHNDKTNKCNFAYMEKPQITGVDGRLRIRAHFTGRSALNMLGQCVGLGDAFNVIVLATPQYHEGNIILRDVTASGDGKTGIYIRKVCTVLSASLARDFKYPLSSIAQKILEDTTGQPGYKREVHHFQVPNIKVSNEALVIEVDFDLTVR